MSIKKVKLLFSSPLGQEVLKYFDARFYINSSTFSPNEKIMSYNEGLRNMVLFCHRCVDDEKFGETEVEERTEVFFNGT